METVELPVIPYPRNPHEEHALLLMILVIWGVPLLWLILRQLLAWRRRQRRWRRWR